MFFKVGVLKNFALVVVVVVVVVVAVVVVVVVVVVVEASRLIASRPSQDV